MQVVHNISDLSIDATIMPKGHDNEATHQLMHHATEWPWNLKMNEYSTVKKSG